VPRGMAQILDEAARGSATCKIQFSLENQPQSMQDADSSRCLDMASLDHTTWLLRVVPNPPRISQGLNPGYAGQVHKERGSRVGLRSD
jgi:hypothetical protein